MGARLTEKRLFYLTYLIVNIAGNIEAISLENPSKEIPETGCVLVIAG